MKKLGRIRAAVKSRTKRLSFCALQNAREFQRGKSQPLCVTSQFLSTPQVVRESQTLSTERDIFFGWQKQHEDTPLFRVERTLKNQPAEGASSIFNKVEKPSFTVPFTKFCGIKICKRPTREMFEA